MRYIVQCGHEGDILQKFDALALVMITSDAAGMSTVSGFRDTDLRTISSTNR